MPERPELDYQRDLLADALTGAEIVHTRVLDPVLLRMLVDGPPEAHLVGRRIGTIVREAHFLIFSLLGPDPPLELAVNPMLAGRFTLCPASARTTKDTGFALGLSDGRELRYRDRKQMGKVYVAPAAQRRKLPGLAKVGLDVLSPDFTFAAFERLARKRRDQVKLFLLDKSALDAFGNAYADETLFAAGIHPKTRVRELDPAALQRLHRAAREVLQDASDVVRSRAPALDEKVRDFLKVRNRKGEPCPTCGAPIRVAGVRGYDAFFCAVCQPDAKGRGFVRWRSPTA